MATWRVFTVIVHVNRCLTIKELTCHVIMNTRLHLGCGRRIIAGYVNIDIEGGDLQMDIRKLDFPDSSVAEIYASHVLEHFGRHEFKDVLREWYRVLKPGGCIYLSVPDIDSAIRHYNEHRDIKILYGAFWGGQRNEYDYHKMGFTFETLAEVLNEIGFVEPERYDTFKYLPEGFDDYSKAFLPHMDFTGQQMSLNIKALKCA